MKLRYPYKNKLLRFVLPFVSVALLTACSEVLDEPAPTGKEDVPVTVRLNFAMPVDNVVATRALTTSQEYNMNDLFIIIFDKDNNAKFKQYYTVEELNHTGINPPTYGWVDVATTSGESYIYGVANVSTNELEDLRTELEAVETLGQFQAVEASLATAGNVERNQAALVMSGSYDGAGSGHADGWCMIPSSSSVSTLSGKILLKRLDSHITFRITTENNDIISFEPTSWRVYNVPSKSFLVSQSDDAAGAVSDNYNTTGEYISFNTSGNVYSFDFYMLENLKEVNDLGAAKTPFTYADRDVEEKEAYTDPSKPQQTVRNTGVFRYVEPMAAYVEIKANMTINLDGDMKRYADVKYVVHLGYAQNDAKDFKSRRNTNYTYNISVKGVDKIVLEVSENEELQPGAEGDVVDAQQRIISLDCHYHTFILGFTKAQMTDFKFQVKTPFTTFTQSSAGISGEDLSWIQFKRDRNNSSTGLQTHNGSLLTLFDLADDVVDWAEQRGAGDNDMLYYTVFVKEYYYDVPPVDQTWSTPYWQYFVNQPERYALLIYSPRYSADGDSSYAVANYLISQKSIQTYYSTTSFNGTETALGVEHYNETGVPLWGSASTTNLSTSNGYLNNYNYLFRNNGSNQWSNYASYIANNSNTLTMNDNAVALAECLARNRDEDGDGVIDRNELKWYLPTISQYQEIYLGAESLTHPLFDANSIGSIADNSLYHFMSSDDKMLWAEEGSSEGDVSGPKELRCVRNLGVASGTAAVNNVVDPMLVFDSNANTFSLDYIETNSIRSGYVSNGELAIHSNFSRTNLPYSKFEVAENFVGTTVESGGRWSAFFNETNNTSLCAGYYQNPDRSDRGMWRAPNQRELTLMRIYDMDYVLANDKYGAYSITYWKYNQTRHFGLNGTGRNLYLDSGYSFGGATLRCVRDVK